MINYSLKDWYWGKKLYLFPDLEPPRQRPLSSASTAKRLIAHGMGLKLPSAEAGSSGFKKQEEARKNRIAKRQNLRDEAWGADWWRN